MKGFAVRIGALHVHRAKIRTGHLMKAADMASGEYSLIFTVFAILLFTSPGV